MAQKYTASKIQDLLNNSLRYKDSLQLPKKWAENAEFVLGNQWGAVTERTKAFPRPVLNFCSYIVTHKVASIQSENVKMVYSNENDDELGKTFTRFSDREAERLKFSDFNSYILDDSAVKGVAIAYYYIQPSPDGLVKLMNERIDPCNIHVGNPKEININKQPWIIVNQRLPIEDIQAIADKNGNKITVTEDKEVLGQEYANKNTDIDGIEKANLINFFYRSREDGKIHLIRLCGNDIVEEDFDLNIRKYPFVVLQWNNKTEDFYSQSEIDHLKANQRQVNTLVGLQLMNTQLAGFPKMWSKKGSLNPKSVKGTIGEILIDNSEIPGLQFGWLQPAPLDQSAGVLQQNLIDSTKQLAGAHDIQTGQGQADNATAILLMQKSGAVALDKLKRKYMQYIEDTALLWLEFFTSYYIIDRQFSYVDELGQQRTAVFNADGIDPDSLNVKIDVGVSSQWSEEFTITSLQNFLDRGLIDFKTYLKYVPDNVVPFKNSLLQEMETKEKAQQQEAMDYILGKMNPTERQVFDQLPEDSKNRYLLKKANEEEQLGMMAQQGMGQQQQNQAVNSFDKKVQNKQDKL